VIRGLRENIREKKFKKCRIASARRKGKRTMSASTFSGDAAGIADWCGRRM
jgi:hypothetical protein